MRYELVNPSDEIYFDAASDKVAAAVALFVGSGNYAARSVETGKDVGGMYLFSCDADAAINADFDGDFKRFVNSHRGAIRAAFASFRYAHERTSINRIVNYAHGLQIRSPRHE